MVYLRGWWQVDRHVFFNIVKSIRPQYSLSRYLPFLVTTILVLGQVIYGFHGTGKKYLPPQQDDEDSRVHPMCKGKKHSSEWPYQTFHTSADILAISRKEQEKHNKIQLQID